MMGPPNCIPNAVKVWYFILPGGRSRRNQHHDLRTKSLIRDLSTRLECRHRVFVRTENHCGNLPFEKISIVVQPDSNRLWYYGETVVHITDRYIDYILESADIRNNEKLEINVQPKFIYHAFFSLESNTRVNFQPLTTLVVLSWYHGKLSFSVCNVIFRFLGWKRKETWIIFKIMASSCSLLLDSDSIFIKRKYAWLHSDVKMMRRLNTWEQASENLYDLIFVEIFLTFAHIVFLQGSMPAKNFV